MTFPKTFFLATPETEAQRLLDIATYVVNRFWQVKGFYLLPHDITDFSGREIYFPDLNYPQSFWGEAKKLARMSDWSIPVGNDPKTTDDLIKIMPDDPPDVKPLQSKWQKAEKDFWQFISQTFPDYFLTIQSLEIWVTRYGRLCSFNVASPQIMAWVYHQSCPGDIAEAVLSSVLRKTHVENGYTWEESEAIVDNIITNTRLNKLFPGWKPTLTGMRSRSKYAAESKNYFAKLGFDRRAVISVSDNKLTVECKMLESALTEPEYEILYRLANENGNIVRFEDIGDIIWKEDACEKYSEWAIAQTVHRLREKLQLLGLTPELIQTKRGEGYYLLS